MEKPEKIPAWIDGAAAVVAAVAAILEEAKKERRLKLRIHSNSKWEKDACEAALRGDMVPLANLLYPAHPLNSGLFGGPIRATLTPATWGLVVQFLTGQRNLKTGRLRGKPGAPKMSEQKRRANSPTHDAAELVPVIEAILRWLYPEQTQRAIKDRALEVTAKLRTISNPETVRRHLTRSKKDRHKI
jgi:hypothetical protein